MEKKGIVFLATLFAVTFLNAQRSVITFIRPPNPLGSLIGIKVYIDGEKILKIGNGDKYDYTLNVPSSGKDVTITAEGGLIKEGKINCKLLTNTLYEVRINVVEIGVAKSAIKLNCNEVKSDWGVSVVQDSTNQKNWFGVDNTPQKTEEKKINSSQTSSWFDVEPRKVGSDSKISKNETNKTKSKQEGATQLPLVTPQVPHVCGTCAGQGEVLCGNCNGKGFTERQEYNLATGNFDLFVRDKCSGSPAFGMECINGKQKCYACKVYNKFKNNNKN